MAARGQESRLPSAPSDNDRLANERLIVMLSDKNARRQRKSLAQLGIDVSAQRLAEIHAGARPNPDDFHVVRAADRRMSPEAAAAATFKRELVTQTVVVTVVTLTVMIATAVLLVLVAYP